MHRRTQHGPGEHHRETVVIVGQVVCRASVQGVDPDRRCPADDRSVGALRQVVGASGGTDGLEVRVGEADHSVEPHSRGQDRQLRTPQVRSDDPVVEERRWGVISVRACSTEAGRQRRERGVSCHLLGRPRLPSGFGVWMVICLRSTDIVAVLDQSFIGRVTTAAEGDQRGDQERNQQPHSETGSASICIPSFKHFAVAPRIDAPSGVRMSCPLSETLQQ